MSWHSPLEAPPAMKADGPKPEGRVVRNLTDDEEGEAIMPKGVYDRATAAPRGVPKLEVVKEPPAPKKPRKARAAAVVPVRAKADGGSRFEVALDLRKGAVTINAAAGSLTLAPDEIAALFAFLGRRS